MRRRSQLPALLMSVAVLSAVARAAGAPQTQTAVGVDAFELAFASMQALSAIESARSRLDLVASEGLPNVMRATRLAIGRLDSARLQLRPSRESTDTTMRSAAAGLESALDALIDPMVSRVDAMEKVLDPGSDPSDLASLITRVEVLNARLQAGWLQLPRATLGVTQVMVDSSRTVDGNLAYMKLTRAQHQRLAAELNRLFPRLAEATSADDPVVVSARVWQSFLASGWRAADERTPS